MRDLTISANDMHICATPAQPVQAYVPRASTCELHNLAVGSLHAKLRVLGAPDLICDFPGLEGNAQGVVKPRVGGTCSVTVLLPPWATGCRGYTQVHA